ncbi:MAG: deoxyribose-phosphate aldolase [Treponema sp.]|nr:deoxyribose-phosphate aldolase [Treponema sp.]
MNKKEIAKCIDHTLLAPQATINQIVRLCQEAVRYDFASVCVNPIYVKVAADELRDSDVKVCTVIGFPLGANTSQAKAFEASQAIKDGASEVDMVINIGAAKDGRYSAVGTDISEVVQASRKTGEEVGRKIIVKVILETCFLTDEEIESTCLCAKKAGADFVKTSTGFANPKGIDGQLLPNGASIHHVKLMRKTVGPDMGVKASGGIRSVSMVKDLIEAGANRIGTSSGVHIIEAWEDD